MNLRYNGQRIGLGISIEEAERKLDPLYDCHNDMVVKLKVIGAAIAAAAITAGVILVVRK